MNKLLISIKNDEYPPANEFFYKIMIDDPRIAMIQRFDM